MKILVTGVHIDDCEGGVGGTTALLTRLGHEVVFLNIKQYQHYKPRNLKADAQSMHAAEVLGARKIILDYSGTKYYKNSEKTVRACEEIIADFKPDILFMQRPLDNHIEHIECANTLREAIFAAAVDGVCPNEIYSYENAPLQTMCYFQPHFYINIDEVRDRKKECLSTFAVEHAAGEKIWQSKAVCHEYRGLACGFPLAEAFMIVKYPDGGNDFHLRNLLAGKFRWSGTKMYYPQSGLAW
ncbi:MAG: PIG-L family deacetylase [Clostridia bacterium]|nr:PIG-L family deacetylase [Clostridia bacterium]